LIRDLNNSIEDLVWGTYLQKSGRAGRMLVVLLRYLYGLFRDILYGQLTLRSMSLVYSTLLSVVPLIALSFSVLKGFGLHKRMEPYLYTWMEPLGAQGAEITTQVIEFVDNVKGGLLGGVSLAFFIYTAISMVQKVEESFNYVWYVSKPRSFARRFSEYMIVLLIGPVIMVIALGILASIGNYEMTRDLLSSQALSPVVVLIGKLAPYLMVSAVFTFLYIFVPNTHVRFSAALVGGVAGGILWSTIGALFTTFVVYASSRELIYSGFAVAITALIWLYLNWLVLLIGAQIAFYVQKPSYLRRGRREPQLSNATSERLALNLMYFVGSAFREAGRSITLNDIGEALKIPTLTIAPVINKLERAGLLLTTEEETLVPGRDLACIRLREILDVVREGGATGSHQPPRWASPVDELGARIDTAIADCVDEKTLANLLDTQATA